jgi:peptide/nickel transport system permease protein
MSRHVIGRIGQARIVLWATFTVSFIVLQALLGDAILIKFLNPELGIGPDQIADIRASYGADTPLWAQYLHSIFNFLTGFPAAFPGYSGTVGAAR